MDLFDRSRALFPDSQAHYRAPRAPIGALRAPNLEDPFLDHLGLVPYPKVSFKVKVPRDRGRIDHHQLAPQLHDGHWGTLAVRTHVFQTMFFTRCV